MKVYKQQALNSAKEQLNLATSDSTDIAIQKQIALSRKEPNMVMESKEEIIDTIAKADYSGFDNFGLGIMSPNMTFKPKREPLFQIKKGDPIQVIKQTNIGTLRTDVVYLLRKYNGEIYAKTKEELSKQPVLKPDNSTFSGWKANSGIASGLFNLSNPIYYRLPNSVVEDGQNEMFGIREIEGKTTITDKIYGKSTMFGRPRTIPLMVIGAIVGGYYAKSKNYSTLLGVIVGGAIPFVAQGLLTNYERRLHSNEAKRILNGKLPTEEVKFTPDVVKSNNNKPFMPSETKESCEKRGKKWVELTCVVAPCPQMCVEK